KKTKTKRAALRRQKREPIKPTPRNPRRSLPRSDRPALPALPLVRNRLKLGNAARPGLLFVFGLAGRGSGHAAIHGKAHLALGDVGINDHVVAVEYFAFQDLERQRILDKPLDGPLQWPGAVGSIVAFQKQQLFCSRRELDGDLAISQQLAQ